MSAGFLNPCGEFGCCLERGEANFGHSEFPGNTRDVTTRHPFP